VQYEPPFGTYKPTVFQSTLITAGRRLPGNWLGRRTASLIRSTLSRICDNPLDLIVLGQRMRLHASDNACEKRLIVTPQLFEPAELAFIRSRLHPGFMFVDIGSNVGAYSIFVASNAGPGARVIAIEPNEIVLNRLRVNAAANDLKNILSVRTAIGDCEGEALLRLGRQNFGGSSLLAERRLGQGSEVVQVPMRTLLSVVQEACWDRIDLLKMDIEGFEDRALMPFLQKAPPHLLPRALIVEKNTKDWEKDVIVAAIKLGYRNTYHHGSNAILVLET
jgi:FkbM family methyltransferase